MSSILKALKKAENRPPTKIENRFWQYSMNTPKLPSSPARSNNIVLWIICLLLGVNVLVAGGRYLWQDKSVTPAPAARSENAGMAVKERAAVPVSKALSTPAEGSQSLSSLETAAKSPGRSPREEALRAISAGTQETVTTVSSKSRRADIEKSAPEKFLPPKKNVSRKEFDFSDYKLEGVVFTDSSKETFAVINGEIVRNGESVGDLRVTRIQSDYVEVQSKDGAFASRLNLY